MASPGHEKKNLSSSLTVRAVTKDLTTTLWSETRVPGISRSFYWTTGSQLLKAGEGDHSYGWQLLATQPWAPPKKQAPITPSKPVERGKEAGGEHYILSPHDCETPRQNKCSIKLPQNTKMPECFNTVEHTVTRKHQEHVGTFMEHEQDNTSTPCCWLH